MIKIRLSRGGAKGSPFYKIVAIDERKKRGGRAKDVLGTWYPEKNVVNISTKKLDEWVAKGAQVTNGVVKLLSIKN